MSDGTGISWTDATWNPVRGCSRVSEGCRNCYAERVAARFSGPGQPYEGLVQLHDVRQYKTVNGEPTGDFRTVKQARWNGTVRMVPEHLADPMRWRRPRRIFVNSMSDLFHESLTNEQIAAVFGVMAAAPQHTFQVLTKRAERMRDWFRWVEEHGDLSACLREAYCWLAGNNRGDKIAETLTAAVVAPWPLPNVWLGVSVENQAAADERIPFLLETPAALRFLSCEPLLGELDLHAIQIPGERDGLRFSALQHHHDDRFGSSDATLDWVIAGCESGPGARPCDVAWLRSLRDQCASAAVPFFLKQAASPHDGLHMDPTYWVRPDVHERRDLVQGPGSKRKAGGVIELPWLDGVQHAAFPEPP